jgi:hypothetical protein
MVTVDGRERGGGPRGRAGTLLGRGTSRLDEIEALGLLLGILGILILVAAIIGTVSIGWA